MKLKELETTLQQFYTGLVVDYNEAEKQQIYDRMIGLYKAQRSTESFVRWLKGVFSRRNFYILIFLTVLLGLTPLTIHTAKTITIAEGQRMTVIRDGQTIQGSDTLRLQSGDHLVINNNGFAQVENDIYKATLNAQSVVEFMEGNMLYITHGQMAISTKDTTIVLTPRGQVVIEANAGGSVTLRDTGNVQLRVITGMMRITDNTGAEQFISAGRSITLQTDMSAISSTPTNTEAIEQQVLLLLDIARTKAITALRHTDQKEYELSESALQKARQTYTSIAGLMDRSESEFDALTVSNGAVADFIIQRTSNTTLINEVQALKTLLNLVSSLKNIPGIHTQTGVETYDDYILLERLKMSAGTGEQWDLVLLQEKYIQRTIGDILASPIKLDQVTLLSTITEKLPRSSISVQFLQKVADMLPNNLQTLLQEKIQEQFISDPSQRMFQIQNSPLINPLK